MRQRMHFDALTLLAVFIQHGDRKRSQQRLVCRGDLDVEGGDLRDLPGARHDTAGMGVLFESPSVRACLGDTMVTLRGVGATFGGAGQFTGGAAKIHLKSWAGKDVFATQPHASHGGSPECRGNINVSGSAGADAGENPRISEAGRSFLATQLERLTPEHIRAIFETARIDRLGEVPQWQDRLHRTYTGLDAWVAVFTDKVGQNRAASLRSVNSGGCAPSRRSHEDLQDRLEGGAPGGALERLHAAVLWPGSVKPAL